MAPFHSFATLGPLPWLQSPLIRLFTSGLVDFELHLDNLHQLEGEVDSTCRQVVSNVDDHGHGAESDR